MHYIGSKKFLLPFIEESVRAVVNLEHPEELVFCDLFAGTGGLGFECISRGADKVYFVDSSKDSIKNI